MGIDVGASIVAGLPKKDLEHLVAEDQDFDDWYDREGLDRISPYYDAGDHDCIFGVCVVNVDYTYMELGEKEEFSKDVKNAFEKFKEITGMDGKLYLSLDVW